MRLSQSVIKILLLSATLLVFKAIAAATLTPLQNLSVNGGGQLLPMTDGQLYSADLPPAWSVSTLWQDLDKEEDDAVLFSQGKVLTIVPAATTCPSEPFISRPRRQQVNALSQGRLLKTGGICPKNNEQHQGFTALWLYDPQAAESQQWQQVGQLQQSRVLHSSTTLPDDSVIIIGGIDPVLRAPAYAELPALRMLASVEIWRDRQVTQLPALPVARALHSSTRLPDGQILVAGGLGADLQPLRDTWLYRPGDPAWRQGPDLPQAVFDHAAVQTRFGLLIAGGRNAQSEPVLQTLLLRDIKQGFSQLSPLMIPIAAAQLSQNLHGELLLSGGYTAGNAPNPLLLQWDGQRWQQVFSQNVPNQRGNWAVQAMPDGHWLLASNDALYQLKLPEQTDRQPAEMQSYSHYPRMARNAAEAGSTVAELPDGRLLVSGGSLAGTAVATTFSEVMDPATGRWQKTAPTWFAHHGSEAIVLPDGRVLLYGGLTDNRGNARQSGRHQVELFDPATSDWQLLTNLEFGADERVQARLLPDGAVLFVASSEYNPEQYTHFRALRFEPVSGQIQRYQAPAGSFSADPLQPPAVPLPASAYWQLRPDGSVALFAGHFATYIAEPDCVRLMRQQNTVTKTPADTGCDNLDEDTTYGWQGQSSANSQILLWRVFEQTIETVPALLADDGSNFRFYSSQRTTPLTSANGDLLFKLPGPDGRTLLRLRQQDLKLEWLAPHPQKIWQDDRLFELISWFSFNNDGVVVADYYLAPGSKTWQPFPPPATDADWIGSRNNKVYAVSFTAPFSAVLNGFALDGAVSTSTDAGPDTATSPPPLHAAEPQASWQFVTAAQLPASSSARSSLLALRSGDVLQALRQDPNQLRVQIWRSDSQQWQVLPAPPIRLYSIAPQLLQLPDQQMMLVAQAELPDSAQTELQCYLTDDTRQPHWRSCGTFPVTDNSEFALAAMDDGSPALMINAQLAQLFDLKTNSWHPQVPYQHQGELVQGVAVRLEAPLLSLGDTKSGTARAADALGAQFIQRNSSDAPRWQWSAAKQHWAYIFRDSPMAAEAVELTDGCWLSFRQQQFVLFDPRTGKAETLPTRYALENTTLAARADDSLLLVGKLLWQRGDASLWFQASCTGVNPVPPPTTLTTPAKAVPPETPTIVNDKAVGEPAAPAQPLWQLLAITLAPLFYPCVVVLLASGLYYRVLRNRGEPTVKLKWVISILVLVLATAGYGQKFRQLAVSGEVSPLSETCIAQLQHRLKDQPDASNWPSQLSQCIPLAELPELDCRLLGTWSQHNEQSSHTTYITRFDSTGRYTVTDASGNSVRDYRGYWGIWQSKLVWFAEGSVDPFADANPIISLTADTVVIRESNGSKTTLRRQDHGAAINCPAG